MRPPIPVSEGTGGRHVQGIIQRLEWARRAFRLSTRESGRRNRSLSVSVAGTDCDECGDTVKLIPFSWPCLTRPSRKNRSIAMSLWIAGSSPAKTDECDCDFFTRSYAGIHGWMGREFNDITLRVRCPRLCIRATISSSSRAHCGAKCRHADTGSLQAQALFTIPDNACGISGMTTGAMLAPTCRRG